GAGQVELLLPGGPGCLVLIAAVVGWVGGLDDAVLSSLDVLTPGEAAELFCWVAARPGLVPSNLRSVRLPGNRDHPDFRNKTHRDADNVHDGLNTWSQKFLKLTKGSHGGSIGNGDHAGRGYPAFCFSDRQNCRDP